MEECMTKLLPTGTRSLETPRKTLQKIKELHLCESAGEKFKGSLRQVEGNKYCLGRNEGIYHYNAKNNSGYFTDPKTGEIIGHVYPFEGGDYAVYRRNAEGMIDQALYDREQCSMLIITRDKNGNIVNLFDSRNH